MNVTAEDKALLKQIIQILEKSSFKDLSAPQCLTIAIAFERFGEFKKRLDAHLEDVAKFSAVTPSPTPPAPVVPTAPVEVKPENKKKK